MKRNPTLFECHERLPLGFALLNPTYKTGLVKTFIDNAYKIVTYLIKYIKLKD
ncbi:MAG: hypothetical protein AAB332_00190 [Planctomycetota bacterium]